MVAVFAILIIITGTLIGGGGSGRAHFSCIRRCVGCVGRFSGLGGSTNRIIGGGANFRTFSSARDFNRRTTEQVYT